MSVILTMVAVNKTATTLLEVTIVPVILGIHWNLTIITAQVMTLIFVIIIIYNLLSDVDECTLGINGCNQNCVNTEGSYLCSCFAGYHLISNQKTCVG